MDAHSTFSLFATALATGIPGVLPLVPLRRIGRRFFVLLSLVALVLIVLAIVDRGLGIGGAFLACAGFLIAYNVVLPPQAHVDPGRRAARGDRAGRIAAVAAPLLAVGAAVSGAVGLVLDARALAATGPLAGVPVPLVAASALASACLLGASVVAMVLGHWYLVARGLSFAPLRRVTAVLAGALLARTGVAGAGLWAQWGRWGELVGAGGPAAFFVGDGVFVMARALFGLLAPLVMVGLAWGCLRIESNQSATGILYVVVAFVFLGELLAKHYLVSPGLVI